MTADEIQALIQDTTPLATEEQIQAFEAEIGTSLPPDYRTFLAHCNGGWVDMRIEYEGAAPNGSEHRAFIMSINGIRKGNQFSLSQEHVVFKDRIPKSLISIMDDPSGNLICLGIHGRDRGFIYVWDHVAQPNEDSWDGEVESARHVELIAPSFATFLSGLHKSKFAKRAAQQPLQTARAKEAGEVGETAQTGATGEPRDRLRVEVRSGVMLVHFVDHRFVHEQECGALRGNSKASLQTAEKRNSC